MLLCSIIFDTLKIPSKVKLLLHNLDSITSQFENCNINKDKGNFEANVLRSVEEMQSQMHVTRRKQKKQEQSIQGCDFYSFENFET